MPDNAGKRIIVERKGGGERGREGGRENEGVCESEYYYDFAGRYVDPFEDQFEKSAEKRQEAVAKNEFQRLRNVAMSQKAGKIKGIIIIMHNSLKLVGIHCYF